MGVDPELQPMHGMLFFCLNALGATFLVEPAYRLASPFVAMTALQSVMVAIQATIALVLFMGWQSNFLVVIVFLLAALSALSQAISCDFGCNVSFPCPDNVVLLWQMVIGQAATAGFNLLFEQSKTWSPRPFSDSFLMMAGFTAVAMAMCSLWRGSYRRSEAGMEASQGEDRQAMPPAQGPYGAIGDERSPRTLTPWR